jgi:hypothetical protein
LKRESPIANTFMVTLANSRADSGYIPNDTAFGALTFQVLGSKLKPGCAETAIVNGLLDLIEATKMDVAPNLPHVYTMRDQPRLLVSEKLFTGRGGRLNLKAFFADLRFATTPRILRHRTVGFC